MKTLLSSFAIGVACIGTAVAQQPAPMPATPMPAAPAITAPNPSTEAPLPGANSFTEAQAKVRLEGAGYTNIGTLTKDADGIWRGMATKGGSTGSVAVDYKGNVVAR